MKSKRIRTSQWLRLVRVKHTSDDGVETYGPETETHDREVDQVTHGWPTLEEADPAFVSLVDAQESNMPKGKGTYGTKKGRPPKKPKKK